MSATILAPVAPPLIAAGPVGWAALGIAAVGLTVVTVIAARKAAEAFPQTPPVTTEPCPTAPPASPPAEKPDKPPPEPKPPPVLPPVGIGSNPNPPNAYPQWTPSDPDHTHPDHDEVDEARKEDSWDCGKLGLAIDILTRDLKFRRWDMQRHGGGDERHRKAYRERQQDLRRLVKRAKEAGCPYNPEADLEISRSPNTSAPNY